MKLIIFGIAALTIAGCKPSEQPPNETSKEKEAGPEAPKKSDFSKWPTACESLSTLVTGDNGARVNTVFEKTPHDLRFAPSWELKWRGVSVPIPETEYDTVRFSHGERPGQIEVVMEGIDAVVTLRYAQKQTPNLSEVHPEKFDEYPEFVDAFAAKFGAFPNERAKAMLYKVTAKDLGCKPETAVDDLLIWYTFTNAGGVAPDAKTGTPYSAYPFTIPGFPNGVRRYTTDEDAEENWEVLLLPESVEDYPRYVTYRVAPGGPLQHIGHYVGVDYDRSEAPRPDWLAATESLFTKFDKPTLDHVEAVFRETDIKTKGTIGKLRAKLPTP